ncbi:MBL fold metallo-hydrolase [Paraburkholderia youngii]|uniref:MBL fold metallo-hydrolase n=1 Tax=Paraburkholderia youngii TaxID=2782701 RepID=A0A7Y6N3W2_9BURK|nr:MBL fold metallo-hydrolase [Paraburkholderia youngii]NUY04909.1 MBL fold metallo-hydrolase [Paraburkholderia youngii]
MVRPEQLLHAQRQPVAPRPAATMLLVRDALYEGSPTIEVLMTRRSAQASFAPGAFVFPGGAIDSSDARIAGSARRRATQDDTQAVQAVAAIRETFEELGVLLAWRHDGVLVDDHDIAKLERATAIEDHCSQHGLTLAADCVYPFAHWITDRDLPRRFDVQFFVARMPVDQTAVADGAEQFEPLWVRPDEALARNAAGDFAMIFPTVRTLERLRSFDSVDALLAACRAEKSLWSSCPRGGMKAGSVMRCMEGDTPYGELRLVCPDGQVLHCLDWRSTDAIPLLRNVMRLTATNGGLMTGPGTNSYIVGTAATGFIVVDPGPGDLAHLQRIFSATGGDIRMIVCTHSHVDHAPGARPLQSMCPHKPPILGVPSGPAAKASNHFAPDRELLDGEVLTLAHDGETHRLLVVSTPGHASNHVCLVLLEDGLLFSGDHILNGSTTIIDPPDGNMTAYLASLDRLDAICTEREIEFILPAHGYVLDRARDQIARLKAHRFAREAKIADAVKALPSGSIDDWLRLAYTDVPERLWSAASRSLLAHLERLDEHRHLISHACLRS